MTAQTQTQTPSFTFADTKVPVRAGGPGRPAEPNPFLATVADLDKRRKENDKLSLTVTVPKSEAVKRENQLRKAGDPINRTVRITTAENGDNVDITFWTVDKVKHAEKTEAEKKAIAEKRKATLAKKAAEKKPAPKK